MRSSPGTLQNHYLKKDVDLMQDEEPEPPPQQKILTEINKNVVETPLKQVKKFVVDEKLIKKEVEPPKIKKLIVEQQEKRHNNNKKEYLKGYYENNKNELIEKAKQNDKNKYWLRYTRELSANFIKWENIKPSRIIKYKLHKQGNKYWSELDPNYNKYINK